MKEIAIKIPEEKYNMIKSKMYCGIYDVEVYKAIANGTPFPKGHGRLVDADLFVQEHPLAFVRDVIDDAPTIIEADRAESEDK